MPLPPVPSKTSVALAWLGTFIAISILALLSQSLDLVLILGSFGASCVLIFGYPDVPFSQPRNIIVGHFVSSLIGLVCLSYLGNHWSLAIAVASAVAFMMLARVVHPPAGSNPVIVFLMQPSWGFLLFPTLAGAIILVLCALLYHNDTRSSKYPKYW